MVGLFLHASYLDDGALAGKSSLVLNTLHIYYSHYVLTGVFFQFKPLMEILGPPIGNANFCIQYVTKKYKAALDTAIQDFDCGRVAARVFNWMSVLPNFVRFL